MTKLCRREIILHFQINLWNFTFSRQIYSYLYFKASTKVLSYWAVETHDNVLSINNNHFHSYVDSIYPNELETKDTTESSTSASYLDVLIKFDTNGKITTQLYDKRDDCISPSSTFLTNVVIFQLHLHMVYTYCSLFDMQKLTRSTISFWFEAVYWQTSWCHKGFNCLLYRHFSVNFMVVTSILFAHTFRFDICCLIYFIPIVKPFLTHWSWLQFVLFI
jgi:hypothetical protein